MRDTKVKQVLEHLRQYGTITSWQAIQQYGATRLAAIICDLRKRGYDIKTETRVEKDRNGNTCHYALYIFDREKGDQR